MSDTTNGPLAGKVGIVTGAASGIGRATALAAVAQGARVVVADLNEAGGQETVELAGGTANASFIRTDVAVLEDAEAMVAHAVETFGRLDFAHNNAGIDFAGPATADLAPEDWHRVLQINLTGCWHCMRAEIPAMLASGGGAIVNTSSSLGLVGIPRQVAYVAAKHGVVGLTRGAAMEYSSQGIRINTVAPGVIETPLFAGAADGDPTLRPAVEAAHPIGRLGEPEEIAAAVTWLVSDAASFATGMVMAVDGGFTTH
ncbi:MAG TPA: SDR family oxidoreductase [Solirubrobacteraceae bacterium]|nr:SDR family oxidoreductase [Solirubrobacteraceae bacterium]